MFISIMYNPELTQKSYKKIIIIPIRILILLGEDWFTPGMH
jgi:hypothetical protein